MQNLHFYIYGGSVVTGHWPINGLKYRVEVVVCALLYIQQWIYELNIELAQVYMIYFLLLSEFLVTNTLFQVGTHYAVA